MFKSVKISHFLGIPIRVDLTFLLVGPLFAWLIKRNIATAGIFLNTSVPERQRFDTTRPELPTVDITISGEVYVEL